MVKWLRHRPFTAASWVRIPYASPTFRAISSAGRALALQARCHRFESYCSHQNKESTEKSVLFWFERTVGENLYSSPLVEDGKKKQKMKNNYLFPSERQGSANGRFLCNAKVLPTAGSYCSHQNKESTVIWYFFLIFRQVFRLTGRL